MSEVFGNIVSYKIPLEVNEILYCDQGHLLGDRGGKLKIGPSHPVISAFKTANQELQDKDFIDITESLKHVKIVK